MKKRQTNAQLEDDVIGRLNDIGKPYGMSVNSIIAAAACELSRIPNRPGELWHALGRIAGDGALELMPEDQGSRPAPRKQAVPVLTGGR